MGDALVPILLGALGYESVGRYVGGARTFNAGCSLLMIGSLLNPTDLARIPLPAAVWGCGWRGEQLPLAYREKLHIHAVRGPHSVRGLGLPDDTPMGDPALLLPLLAPQHFPAHDRAVVIPHFLRVNLLPRHERLQRTGCHEVLTPMVIQAQQVATSQGKRELLAMGRQWLKLGFFPHRPWGAVARVAGAGFVLTGSLHGAILAQAYGVPWAAYDDGYVNAPAKWEDWAAYLGVRLTFVATLAEGMRWWQSTGRHGTVRGPESLLEAFPYPLPPKAPARTGKAASIAEKKPT